MAATYLAIGLSLWAIAAMFALAFVSGAQGPKR
jgi:hypothetical protein